MSPPNWWIFLLQEKNNNGVGHQPASAYSRGSVLAGGGARITLCQMLREVDVDVAPQGRYSTPWKKNQTKGGNPYSMLQLQSSLLQMVLGGRFLRYLNTEPITEYLDN